jgi:two-component system nitrogen regulation response regulator NtrX
VLAATNKNLEEEIEKGNFRADLFWRLNVVPIHVPNLVDRLEDIPLLVSAIQKSLQGKALREKTFSEDAYTALMEHHWPGNVRELRNFIERVVIMCQEDTITASNIRLFMNPAGSAATSSNGGKSLSPFMEADYKTAKRLFEKEYLQQKLLANDNNISKTAEQVGLERSHLHKKLKSFELIQ